MSTPQQNTSGNQNQDKNAGANAGKGMQSPGANDNADYKKAAVDPLKIENKDDASKNDPSKKGQSN